MPGRRLAANPRSAFEKRLAFIRHLPVELGKVLKSANGLIAALGGILIGIGTYYYVANHDPYKAFIGPVLIYGLLWLIYYLQGTYIHREPPVPIKLNFDFPGVYFIRKLDSTPCELNPNGIDPTHFEFVSAGTN